MRAYTRAHGAIGQRVGAGIGAGAAARSGRFWCVLGAAVRFCRCAGAWERMRAICTAFARRLLVILCWCRCWARKRSTKSTACQVVNITTQPNASNRAIETANPTARSRNFNVINRLLELLHLSGRHRNRTREATGRNERERSKGNEAKEPHNKAPERSKPKESTREAKQRNHTRQAAKEETIRETTS